jgi:hypothetical protein
VDASADAAPIASGAWPTSHAAAHNAAAAWTASRGSTRTALTSSIADTSVSAAHPGSQTFHSTGNGGANSSAAGMNPAHIA